MTPDPYKAQRKGNDPRTPQSWNRYSYTKGDPVNRYDPQGADDCDAGDDCLIEGDPTDPDLSNVYGDWGDIAYWDAIAAQIAAQLAQAAATPPQLICDFTGYHILPTAPQVLSGGIAYANVVTLNYSAAGGTGGYQWTVTQMKSVTGFVTYYNGYTFQEPGGNQNDPVSPGQVSAIGSTMSYTDAPGIGDPPGANIFKANVAWTLNTSVSVTSGDQTVQCPEVIWGANINWKTVKHSPVVTGSAEVIEVLP